MSPGGRPPEKFAALRTLPAPASRSFLAPRSSLRPLEIVTGTLRAIALASPGEILENNGLGLRIVPSRVCLRVPAGRMAVRVGRSNLGDRGGAAMVVGKMSERSSAGPGPGPQNGPDAGPCLMVMLPRPIRK